MPGWGIFIVNNSKIVVNGQPTEQVSHFNFLGGGGLKVPLFTNRYCEGGGSAFNTTYAPVGLLVTTWQAPRCLSLDAIVFVSHVYIQFTRVFMSQIKTEPNTLLISDTVVTSDFSITSFRPTLNHTLSVNANTVNNWLRIRSQSRY